jgi:hypothetical protein
MRRHQETPLTTHRLTVTTNPEQARDRFRNTLNRLPEVAQKTQRWRRWTWQPGSSRQDAWEEVRRHTSAASTERTRHGSATQHDHRKNIRRRRLVAPRHPARHRTNSPTSHTPSHKINQEPEARAKGAGDERRGHKLFPLLFSTSNRKHRKRSSASLAAQPRWTMDRDTLR